MFSHQLDQNGIAITPKAFGVEHCYITTNNGKNIDLIDSLQNIKIYEGLYQSGIMVELFLKDSLNLIHELKLSGNEKVRLKLSRRDAGNVFFSKFDLKDLYVSSLKNYSEINLSSKGYTLECVSKHVYYNNKKLLKRSFSGNPSELIKDIVQKELNSKIDVQVKAKGNIKGIYPIIQPLQAISWLLRNSFDDGTPFYFYETPGDGLKFTSYKRILETFIKKPYQKYNNIPFLSESIQSDKSGKKAFEEEIKRIISNNSNLNISKLQNSMMGAFKSQLNKIDISTKTHDKSIYTYKLSHSLNKFPPINDKMKIDGESITSFQPVKHHYVSYNTNSYSNNNSLIYSIGIAGSEGLKNYHNPTDQSILKALAQTHNLDTIKQEIVLPGDFNLSSGKIINLTILKNADVTVEMQENDKFIDEILSGNHLVTGIIHEFGSQGYQMTVSLKKDSFIKEVNGI